MSQIKPLIVYVKTGCAASKALLDSANPAWYSKAHFQSIDELETLPPWIDGSPIAVHVQSGGVLKGTSVIARWLDTQPFEPFE
tara:strand:+ start:4758 stop:5006 length:249 start_codon:yes stop_codon:yes gene_type:complete